MLSAMRKAVAKTHRSLSEKGVGRLAESRLSPRNRGRLNNVDAHAAAGALHLVDRAFKIETVEIGHLELGDLFDLGHGDFANLGLVRLSRSLSQVNRALDQNRYRRSLCNEGERPVAKDRDHDRNDET